MTVKAHPGIYKIPPSVADNNMVKSASFPIRLILNENPYGCSPQVSEALKSQLHTTHAYPSSKASNLRQAIADHYRLEPQQILCGNGSEEILHLVARCFAKSGTEIVLPYHGFQVYPIAAKSVGATPVYAPQPRYTSEKDAILRKITPKTKIIYIDNPANPLGTYMDKDKLQDLIEQVPPHILVVVDAAYADYLEASDDYTSGFELVKKHPNLLITRTFSKLYGLASLRLGWCYGSLEVIDLLNRICPSFNVNSFAQIAGVIALSDQSWIKAVSQKTLQTKEKFIGFLQEKKYSFLPSGGNFVLVEFSDIPGKSAKETLTYLGKNGVLVRSVASYDLPNHLRISIGTDTDMAELCHLLEMQDRLAKFNWP